jgi:deazaflavin-dependent oxidoreductase (nitroreductase family)
VRVTLTLTVTGRRTGDRRSVELYAFPDGDRFVVVGSRGGSARDPFWAENLRVDPNATIAFDGRIQAVRAREVSGPERERLWALVSEIYPTYLYYQGKTKRTIPIFALDVVDEEASEPASA